MEITCWTCGYHFHSKDPTRQVFQAAVTNKIGVSAQYRYNRVGAAGEEGVEDQEDTAPEAGPPGEPLDKFRPRRKCTIESGPRPW